MPRRLPRLSPGRPLALDAGLRRMNEPGAPPFTPGQILAGKYRIERVLGQGGMGVVLAALHLQLEERVAIKLMLTEAASNAEAVGRFVREARAAARLESAHVAKVSDVGTLEDGRPYMVMEYLDGQDLSQVLQSTGPLLVQDAVDYLLQASEAIAEAHSIGIIHRDLKPSNLFLTRRRDRSLHVKVLDFGISKLVSTSSQSENAMTRTSTMMGSPLYMSPEQMTSVKDVDGRSDIWALGVILFEFVTGSPPFMGDTLPQVCAMVLQRADPPASSLRAGLPPELDAIIHRCLAKNPDDRFQNVAELAIALQAMAGRHGRTSIERILQLTSGAEPPPASTIVFGRDAGASYATGASAPRTGSAAALTPSPAPAPLPATVANWSDTNSTPFKRRRAWLALPLLGVPALGVMAWSLMPTPPQGAAPAEASPQSATAATETLPPRAAVAEASAPPAPLAPPPKQETTDATAAAPLVPTAAPQAPLSRPLRSTQKRASSAKAAPAETSRSSVAASPPPAPPPPPPAAKAEPTSPDMGGRL
jgi:serine/threonine protein kinase